jgi:hypothetical protein
LLGWTINALERFLHRFEAAELPLQQLAKADKTVAPRLCVSHTLKLTQQPLELLFLRQQGAINHWGYDYLSTCVGLESLQFPG